MELIYKKISQSEEIIDDLEQLYVSAFPVDERRDCAEFRKLIAGDNNFHIIAGFRQNRLVSFISYWIFGTTSYIEHFAVIPEMRGYGIGQEMMSHFISTINNKIILEVEPPTDVISVKRIKFYERLGFRLWETFLYIQPPYDSSRKAIELKLMTHGDFTESELAPTASTLKREVYGAHTR